MAILVIRMVIAMVTNGVVPVVPSCRLVLVSTVFILALVVLLRLPRVLPARRNVDPALLLVAHLEIIARPRRMVSVAQLAPRSVAALVVRQVLHAVVLHVVLVLQLLAVALLAKWFLGNTIFFRNILMPNALLSFLVLHLCLVVALVSPLGNLVFTDPLPGTLSLTLYSSPNCDFSTEIPNTLSLNTNTPTDGVCRLSGT